MSQEISASPAMKLACVPCRTVKIKCRPVLGSATCERCTRNSLDCVFHHNKRGRKPGTRLYPIGRGKAGIYSQPTLNAEPTTAINFNLSQTESPVTSNGSTSSHASSRPIQHHVSVDFLAQSQNLQPLGLLNRDAMEGRFSLENVLSINHSLHMNMLKASSTVPDDDPIRRGFVTYHIATSLFHGFMRNLNPFICVLDPVLYTFQYVQERSSFLLTVMLAASAKVFNPALYPSLYKYSEELFVTSFRQGTKSIEAIQATLLHTYWKEPDDARSWSSIGYVIRLCIELGLHKPAASHDNEILSEIEERQRRNTERTWFVLFVYDRGMTLQTGKPWMINRSDFIESVNTWYKSPLSTPNDAVLSAIVTLRLSTADIFEILIPQRPSPPTNEPQRLSSLLRTLNPQLQAWQKHWENITEKGIYVRSKILALLRAYLIPDPCHRFLVSFFSTHVRLLLYSFPLQASLTSPVGGPLMDTEAFWITYTSALEMLQLVVNSSLAPHLSFVHDAIHVMIAYAAVFLIKLLLSVHNAIRVEVEPSIIKTIEMAALVFRQQETPPTFSCALQAKFLNNILQEYKKARRDRLTRISNPKACSIEPAAPVRPGSASHSQPISDSLQPQQNPARQKEQSQTSFSLQGLTEVEQSHDIGNSDRQSDLEMHVIQTTSDEQRSQHTHPLESLSGGERLGDNRSVGTTPQNLPFGDDEPWANMFINAGFNVYDGVFLPD